MINGRILFTLPIIALLAHCTPLTGRNVSDASATDSSLTPDVDGENSTTAETGILVCPTLDLTSTPRCREVTPLGGCPNGGRCEFTRGDWYCLQPTGNVRDGELCCPGQCLDGLHCDFYRGNTSQGRCVKRCASQSNCSIAERCLTPDSPRGSPARCHQCDPIDRATGNDCIPDNGFVPTFATQCVPSTEANRYQCQESRRPAANWGITCATHQECGVTQWCVDNRCLPVCRPIGSMCTYPRGAGEYRTGICKSTSLAPFDPLIGVCDENRI